MSENTEGAAVKRKRRSPQRYAFRCEREVCGCTRRWTRGYAEARVWMCPDCARNTMAEVDAAPTEAP
jgi:hypothetical protein